MHQTHMRGVALAIGLHLLTLVLFAAEIIPQTTKRAGEFIFHHGGDNYGYFAQAVALYQGEVILSKYPLGVSFLIMPLLPFSEAPTHDSVLQVFSFIWSALMFPLGLVLLGDTVWRMTQRRMLVTITALLYAGLPLLTLIGITLVWNAEMAEIGAVHMLWAQMLSDGPAAFLTLLAVWLTVLARSRDYDWRVVVLLGSVLGVLVMLRFSAALIAIVLACLFLFERRFKMLALLVAVSLVFYAPQMLYNTHFFGGVLTTGYTELDTLPPYGLFDVRYFLEAIGKIWQRLGVLTVVVASALMVVFAFATRTLWRCDAAWAWLIGAWLLSYLAFYGVYYYSWTGGLMRFLIPALPAVSFIGGIVIMSGYHLVMRKPAHTV